MVLLFHFIIQCTSDIVATLGHHFPATISEVHCIRPEYNRINVFCTRKSGVQCTPDIVATFIVAIWI